MNHTNEITPKEIRELEEKYLEFLWGSVSRNEEVVYKHGKPAYLVITETKVKRIDLDN